MLLENRAIARSSTIKRCVFFALRLGLILDFCLWLFKSLNHSSFVSFTRLVTLCFNLSPMILDWYQCIKPRSLLNA